VLVADDERDIVLTLEALHHTLRAMHSLDRPPLLVAITGKWTKSSDRLLAPLRTPVKN